MSERVQQIIKEAERNWYETHRVYDEILIELVVKECAETIQDFVDHREPASTYASKIQQHFGVK